MTYPEFSRGDKGADVRRLQELLDRVGAMLVCDGDFGGMTERGVLLAQTMAGHPDTGTADDPLWIWLEAQPEPFPPLPTEGVALIAREETGGLAYYDVATRWPHYPGVSSGITIGIGYDLRFKTEPEYRASWAGQLPHSVIDELARDIGRSGTKTRARELKRLGIEIPFSAAWAVFTGETLPVFHDNTQAVYPSLPSLPDLCRAVLVSIVFNRGTDLHGPTRAEMRLIRDLLAEADDLTLDKAGRKTILTDVEDQILSMMRLWPPDTGLHRRRQTEANYWRAGVETW